MTTHTSVLAVPHPAKPRSAFVAALMKPVPVIAAIVLAVIVIAVLGAGVWAPYDPLANDLANSLAGPSAEHWLGTDQLGRDVLSRLLYGGRPDLGAALLVACTALVVGVPLGMVAGYRGGRIDQFLMRIVDIGLALPSMVIVLLVLAVFGNQVIMGYLALGLLLVPPLIRIIRANAIAIRSELFIDAARVAGFSDTRIVFRHILPRLVGSVLVQASLIASMGLIFVSGLAYLGFGVSAPDPSWGTLIAEGAQITRQNPALLLAAGGVLGVTVLCLGLLGDTIRDASVARWARTPSRPSRIRRRRSPGDAAGAAPESSSLLSVRELSVEYGSVEQGQTVVDGVSFEIAAGEIVGLVGESGCGKSTLARAVLGLLRGGGVSGGAVSFEGVELTTATVGELRELRGTSFAFVSQEPLVALDPTQRIGTTLTDAVRLHTGSGRREARARARELLARVRFPDPERVLRLYPHEISGGMAQRIAIARALAGSPKLLIADEPTTALDVTVQAEVLDLLRELRASEGLSILIVTHDWGVVSDLCDRAVVMYAGQVVEQSATDALFHRPAHPYTAGLLASNPSGVAGGATRLPSIPGTIPLPSEWSTGCRFQSRCPLAVEVCGQGPVPLVQSPDGGTSRCLRVDQVERDIWSRDLVRGGAR